MKESLKLIAEMEVQARSATRLFPNPASLARDPLLSVLGATWV
jgi:hypothetical protein